MAERKSFQDCPCVRRGMAATILGNIFLNYTSWMVIELTHSEYDILLLVQKTIVGAGRMESRTNVVALRTMWLLFATLMCPKIWIWVIMEKVMISQLG